MMSKLQNMKNDGGAAPGGVEEADSDDDDLPVSDVSQNALLN